MTATDLLLHITQHGGTLVSATDCTPEEIAQAITENRFGVSNAGNGYVMKKGERREQAEGTPTTSPLHMPLAK